MPAPPDAPGRRSALIKGLAIGLLIGIIIGAGRCADHGPTREPAEQDRSYDDVRGWYYNE